jgi:hypothetical protein
MGKASSNKKVARAAKAGGGRARTAGERNIVFPAALAVVVILGTLLVVYAREDRTATALEAPIAFQDHWHSAYGIYICDEFVPDLPEFTAPRNGGNHTHGDGLIHVHPFSTARAGENATLTNWFRDAGEVLGGGTELSVNRLGVPGGQTYVVGEDTCPGLDGEPIVQVAVWDSAGAALDGADPDRVVTEDFGSIRFETDAQAYTVAFAPEGAELPPPPTMERLAGVGADLGVPESEIPDEGYGPDFGIPAPDEEADADGGADADADGDAEADADAGDAEPES